MKPKDRPSRIFLSLLIFPFLFFAASTAFAQNIHQSTVQSHPQNVKAEIPPGWTVFRGQRGLIVIHPLGWTVQERGKGAFLTYRPGPGGAAGALAVVAPMQKIEAQALGVVQGMGQIFPDLFTEVKAFKSRLLSQNPEVALAEM